MSFQSELLADNPIFLLRLDEATGVNTALDVGPNHLNGTYTGCTRQVSVLGTALSNKGISMAGVATDRVVIPHNAVMNPSGNFAVGCVVNYTVAATSKRIMSKYSGTNTTFILGFSSTSAGKLRFAILIGGTTYEVVSPTAYNDGAPHLVIGARRGTSLELYVDKGLVASVTIPSSAVNTNTAGVALGTNDGSFDDNYNGKMDEAFMLPMAPSLERIETYYDALFFSTQLAGTATLDTGVKADAVLIRNWTTYEHLRLVIPAADGTWSTNLPPGDYEVTIRGPAGYQPITHGPITTVEAP